jgi:hexosaminidase
MPPAALSAYPELSCTGGPHESETVWGIHKEVYCAGNEDTFKFLEKVLEEVSKVFPGPYIHIGGDECPKDRWSECEKCQKRILSEKLKDENELQSYFIKRIEKVLLKFNKRLIGWDEILEGGLAPNAVVHSWRGMDGGIEAANAGHEVIMSPTTNVYFDYYQLKDSKNEPLAIGGYLPLSKVYDFEPIPEKIDKSKRHLILGGQANLWTEYIQTPEQAEYMLLPRLCALAETVWSQKDRKNYSSFEVRLSKHLQRLEQKKINYSKNYE